MTPAAGVSSLDDKRKHKMIYQTQAGRKYKVHAKHYLCMYTASNSLVYMRMHISFASVKNLLQMIKRSIDARLTLFRTLVANAAKHSKVKQQMELYGYTATRIQEGQNLLDQVTLLQLEKENCYSHRNALRQQSI
jgi:hypothetical protein